MKKSEWTAWLWNAVRVVLGFLFLLAASGKFRDPVKFMGGMDEYGIIPQGSWVLPIGAVVMPGVEWLCALMLLLGWRTRAAGLLAGGMLCLFIYAMASAMSRHLDLDCSCFDLMGADPSLLAHGPVVRDMALAGLALAFHFLSTEPSTTERPHIWRSLFMVALYAWVTFAVLDAGPEAWRRPVWYALEVAGALWLVFDLLASGWVTLRWGAILRDCLILGPILWIIFHVLGSGVAMLGWGTIIRDLSMAVPALCLALYGPRELGRVAAAKG
ncbi:MAG: MauE/DoxX family redox-associated membrane protein [bacterium]